eukprot:CAMPEP_0197864934 /NCGR_PEP_ID=MMETSP1438-20131217/43369_1 /TAXON_ID=1461541 /ORGANISM="Pterosperma sp., Strain CCMP1384" /LENGTH=651 /DNA_ID=CAMNT_0043483315 /DNA_START=401 /DNA_END=2356 /DNA_ORIENTATION=+
MAPKIGRPGKGGSLKVHMAYTSCLLLVILVFKFTSNHSQHHTGSKAGDRSAIDSLQRHQEAQAARHYAAHDSHQPRALDENRASPSTSSALATTGGDQSRTLNDPNMREKYQDMYATYHKQRGANCQQACPMTNYYDHMWGPYKSHFDAGAANCMLVRKVKKSGKMAMGIEFNSFVVNEYCSDLRDEGIVQVGPLHESKGPWGVFDVVTCTDVLEHVPLANVEESVEVLSKLAKPGGHLFLIISHDSSKHDRMVGHSNVAQEGFLTDIKVHETVRERSWWLEVLKRHGLVEDKKSMKKFLDYNMDVMKDPRWGYVNKGKVIPPNQKHWERTYILKKVATVENHHVPQASHLNEEEEHLPHPDHLEEQEQEEQQREEEEDHDEQHWEDKEVAEDVDHSEHVHALVDSHTGQVTRDLDNPKMREKYQDMYETYHKQRGANCQQACPMTNYYDYMWGPYKSHFDAGAANCMLVRKVKKSGKMAMGIEFNSFVVNEHCSDLRDEGIVQVGPLHESKGPWGVFDVVTCTDVLEHVPLANVEESVEVLSKLAKPGGHLFLIISHDSSKHDRMVGHSNVAQEGFLSDIKVHETVKDREWWLEVLGRHGLVEDKKSMKMFLEYNMDVMKDPRWGYVNKGKKIPPSEKHWARTYILKKEE